MRINGRALATVLTNLYREYWEDKELDLYEDSEKFDYFMAELYIKDLVEALEVKWPQALNAFEVAVAEQGDFDILQRYGG